jgi:hypothetical protein
VILSFGGEEIEDTRELVRIVGESGVGETVRMLVFRDGETQTFWSRWAAAKRPKVRPLRPPAPSPRWHRAARSSASRWRL